MLLNYKNFHNRSAVVLTEDCFYMVNDGFLSRIVTQTDKKI